MSEEEKGRLGRCQRELGDSTAKYAASDCGPGTGDVALYRVTYKCGCTGYVVKADSYPGKSFCMRHYASSTSVEGCSLGSLVDALFQAGVLSERDLFEHPFAAEERPCDCEFCRSANKEKKIVTVCDRCLRACCWQGVFQCEEAKSAGVRQMSVSELEKLDLEGRQYWRK
jgi:hypothetical protein